MFYVTVSAKISRELYEKIKKNETPISKIVKRALEEDRVAEEEDIKRGDEGIPQEEIVNLIKETRG